jgi:hypothetical protein
MEILYFILGMAVVLQVSAIAIVHTLKNKIEQLEEEFQFHERGNYDVANDLHRRIDDEVKELRFRNDETLRIIEKELSELQSLIDSQSKKKK